MQYPLSLEERAAMLRCLSSLLTQLQGFADVFSDRYGKNSRIAEAAGIALESSTLLEHELILLESTSVEPAPQRLAAAC